MSRYGRRLTKQELINAGITEITPEGRVFRGEVEVTCSVNNQGYKCITIYDRDENGHYIKAPYRRLFKGCKTEIDTYNYKVRTLGLHRVMWAWHYGEVPDGMVIDHINNKHFDLEDYNLDNLQILTPAENLEKEKGESNKMLKCQMTKPKEFYENKLNHYTALYEKAKAEGAVNDCHRLRSNIANTKARLRYWDAHKDEYQNSEETIKIENKNKDEWRQNVRDRKLLEEYKRIFKENGNMGMWHQMCKVIKQWDTLHSIQKEHVFEVLHNFFTRYGVEEPKI